MIRRTIEDLKTRPHHERRAFALMIAFGVVGILFFLWAFFFFTTLHVNPPATNAIEVSASTTSQ